MTVLTRIEEQGCGCGTADHPGDLISIDEAVAQILRNAGHVRESEEVALAGARGRTLAEPIAAIAAAPPFDNAAMDGFALNTACLVGPGPWRLPVVTRIPAGQRGSEPLPMGAAAQIFTGALMPDGADAVVMQENVRRTENTIIVSHEILAGAHVRRKGEDMAAGDMVVPAGRTLTGRDIAACAAAGRATVCVRRRLRVALVVTGDEVNSPGRTLSSGGIWDVNTPMLSALIPAPEIELVDVLGFRDNRAALRQQLSALADEVDLIVTTGGISVGEEDHVKPALSDLGLDMVFSGVAINPASRSRTVVWDRRIGWGCQAIRSPHSSPGSFSERCFASPLPGTARHRPTAVMWCCHRSCATATGDAKCGSRKSQVSTAQAVRSSALTRPPIPAAWRGFPQQMASF